MQNATQSNYSSQYSQRLVVFPVKAAGARATVSDSRTRFERMLIFVLFSLWAIGIVAWTLVSFWGVGHGVGSTSLALHPLTASSSLPTLQSATVVVIRLVLGL